MESSRAPATLLFGGRNLRLHNALPDADAGEIAGAIGSKVITGVAMAATFLWILDASINVSMEPFRAFVADKLNIEQRTAGFVMQSFFIGIGASLASACPTCSHGWESPVIPRAVSRSPSFTLFDLARLPSSPP